MAANKEFAGHTAASLKRRYLANLKRNTQKKFNLDPSEVTLGHVTEHCKQVYGEGRARGNVKKEERQEKVIDFFQRKVEELGITDFI